MQYTKLRRSGLLPYFPNIFLSEEVGYQKPDIRFFLSVLEKLSLKPTECIVIGDNFQTDIQGAKNANIDAIFYQKEPFELTNISSGVHIVDKLLQITTIL